MDHEPKPGRRSRRGALAAVFATAAVAVALPVTGALAGGGSDPASSDAAPAALEVQQGEGQQRGDGQRGDGGSRDRDCPEKSGGTNGQESAFDQAPEGSVEL